jgi:hypothetical protein
VGYGHLFAIIFAITIVVPATPQSVVAAPAPTPVPGGANQLSGVSGGLASTLFNGKVRVRQMAMRTSTADEYTPSGGQHGLVFSYLVSNGTSATRTGSFNASISDVDGVLTDQGAPAGPAFRIQLQTSDVPAPAAT